MMTEHKFNLAPQRELSKACLRSSSLLCLLPSPPHFPSVTPHSAYILNYQASPPLSKLTAIRIQMVQGDDTATTHHFLSLKRKATVLTTVVNAPLSSLVISCSLRELARGETLCCAPCCPTYFTAYYTAARFIITRRSAEKPGLGMLFWDKAFLKPSAIKQWVRGGAGLGPGLK